MLMPFYEQKTYYDLIDAGNASLTPPVPSGGAAPWNGWAVWNQEIPILICPSDIRSLDMRKKTNYMFSVGDQVNFHLNTRNPRGVFGLNKCIRIAEITDGTSNTIAMSERLRNPNGGNAAGPPATGLIKANEGSYRNGWAVGNAPVTCLAQINSSGYYSDPALVSRRAGSIAWDGQTENIGFNTVIGPNGPSCVNNANSDATHGVIPPGSRHPGGVQILMADGSVRFISDNINTGKLRRRNHWRLLIALKSSSSIDAKTPRPGTGWGVAFFEKPDC
jgi:prepilin-type processing-associated H-X9-DG protein